MPKQTNKDLKDASELEVFANSNAGKVMIRSARSEISDIMQQFIQALNKPDLNTFISLACQLKEKLNTLEKFTGAKDLRIMIEESISENPEEQA